MSRDREPGEGDSNRSDRLVAIRAVLRSPYGRAVLAHLATAAEDAVTLADLSAAVTAGGEDRPRAGGGRGSDAPVLLHHTVLPRLAARGLLTYDAEAQVVREWDDKRVSDVLDALDRMDDA